MLNRRKIGPAYERSPVQKLSEWGSRNFLVLLAAILTSVVYWVIINIFIDFVFNFLATGGDDALEKPYSSDDPLWIIVKLVGSIFCITMVVKAKAK